MKNQTQINGITGSGRAGRIDVVQIETPQKNFCRLSYTRFFLDQIVAGPHSFHATVTSNEYI